MNYQKMVGRSVLAAIVAVCTVAFAGPASAQTEEGIKVAGSWTIEVVNPDGTVDGVHRFENAFVGALYLALSLADISSPPSGSGVGHVELAAIELVGCRPRRGSCYTPITVSGTGLVVTMTGSVLVDLPSQGTSTLEEVRTVAALCGSPVSPDDCQPTVTPTGPLPGSGVTNFFDFTEKTLETPILIADGQTINVEVIISFR